MTGRLSAEGYLDRLALARKDQVESPLARNGSPRRVWQLELELDFDSTALGEYWLAHCHGFLVDTLADEPVGVVDDLRVDPSTGAAASLEISSPVGWFRNRRFLFAAEDVRVILPLERRLLIS